MNLKYKPERSSGHQIGDIIYCHAYSNDTDQNAYFFCKGIVVRLPKKESPVYKIIITSVDPKSVLCGEEPKKASALLGKKIAKQKEKVMTEPVPWFRKVYEGHDWLEISKKEMLKVKEIIKRLKKKK